MHESDKIRAYRSRLALETRKRLSFSGNDMSRSEPTQPDASKQSNINRYIVKKDSPMAATFSNQKQFTTTKLKSSLGPPQKTKEVTERVDLLDDTIEIDDDEPVVNPKRSDGSSSLQKSSSTKAAHKLASHSPSQPSGWIRKIGFDDKKPTINRSSRSYPTLSIARSHSTSPELAQTNRSARRIRSTRQESQQVIDNSLGASIGSNEDEEDIDSSWDEENSAALFLDKDLAADRRMKAKVKKSMQSMKKSTKASQSPVYLPGKASASY